MSSFNNDEPIDEAFLEQKRQEYLNRGNVSASPTLTSEEMRELHAQLYPDGPKYPESDGGELACLLDNGDLDILFTCNEPEMKSQGNRIYKPGDEDYDHYFKRHKFDDNPKSKRHAIAKQWNQSTKAWIDLGDYWI